MPTLDLKQITDKLNAEFARDTRKLVFWYDDAAEFAGYIDTFEIAGAKLHYSCPGGELASRSLHFTPSDRYSKISLRGAAHVIDREPIREFDQQQPVVGDFHNPHFGNDQIHGILCRQRQCAAL